MRWDMSSATDRVLTIGDKRFLVPFSQKVIYEGTKSLIADQPSLSLQRTLLSN